MNILLIQIDGKLPNLALKKIERFYLDQGASVSWNFPLLAEKADKVFVSCVFTKNRGRCEEWEGRAEIGGSGYDLLKELPPEIEAVKPRINMGYTTRGCIRKCPFCIVPQKEGGIRVVGDLLDLWDGQAKDIALLDNNILALPDHFEKICKQAQGHRIRLDFNQGLDHRLFTRKEASVLEFTRHRQLRFSFDSMNQLEGVKETIWLLREWGLGKGFWYVLVGFDTTFEEDLARLNYLRGQGQNVFVQRYNGAPGRKDLLRLAQWGNQPRLFAKWTFDYFRAIKEKRLPLLEER